MMLNVVIRPELREDVETLWAYHDMGHELRPADVGIGLGSHDLGVAKVAVDLFQRGFFRHILFSGANSPTTIGDFPQGEAIHYRQYAIGNGVPAEAILVEARATNTQENIVLARDLLEEQGIRAKSVIIMSRPYQQRRAYATCRLVWPEVDVICASYPLSLDDYIESIGDARRVIDMLVGDTQRIEEYAKRGFAIPQDIPHNVRAAFERLVAAGYTSRLV